LEILIYHTGGSGRKVCSSESKKTNVRETK
jgi:hypothetical protein